MTEKDARITFRLSGEAKENLDILCRFTGQKPAEVVRAGIAQIMAPYFGSILSAKGMPIVRHTSDNPPAHTCVDGNSNELPISNETSDNELSDISRKNFQQAFIGVVDNCKFPPRIARAIKENWNDIEEFGVDANELGRLYNEYCKTEKTAGREFCHPNSWITNHGWLNENYDDGTGGPQYDTDRDEHGGD